VKQFCEMGLNAVLSMLKQVIHSTVTIQIHGAIQRSHDTCE
jgi:hypothetical protein